MSFMQEVWLVVIDKALIGGLLALAAALYAWHSDRKKAHEELVRSAAASRVAAYTELWKITLSPMSDRTARSYEAEEWYRSGGALFLSLNAAEPFFALRSGLASDDASQERLESLASQLRTELKHDCGTYSRSQAETQIVSAQAAQARKIAHV
jgi:hypothetical protein